MTKLELHLIFGPMFAGKTTRLIETYNHYKNLNKNVYVLSFLGDDRYSETDVVNHDQKSIPSNRDNLIKNLVNNKEIFKKIDVLLIDEGQFFPDLYESVKNIITNDKNKLCIYIFGLDGDSNNNKFGQILDLIPYCDSVEKLTSLCEICKNNSKIKSCPRAIFSHRKTKENSLQILIGSSDIYIPLCRSCYLKENK